MMSLTRRFWHRLVETVARLEVGANLGVDDLLAAQGVAGHEVHGREGRSRDEPDGDQTLGESLEYVLKHEDATALP
jgi:hypothetical protein